MLQQSIIYRERDMYMYSPEKVLHFENIYILSTLNNTFKQNCSEFQDSAQIASISDSSEQDSIGENNIKLSG